MDEGEVVSDELLAEDFLDSDAYDRWRDDQCDALFEALAKVYLEFVKARNGYYTDAPEKFLEETVGLLQDFTKCDLTAINGRITAARHEAKNVEYVQG